MKFMPEAGGNHTLVALTSSLRRAAKCWLLSHNAIISRPPGQFDVTEYKLREARKRGLTLRYALDGGAHVGEWSLMLERIFPGIRVMMVEPRAECQAPLAAVVAALSGAVRVDALLGESHGKATFHAAGTQSSVLLDHKGQSFGTSEEKAVTTIDTLVQEHHWPHLDLIKLDLQGYELKALAGAETMLRVCQAVVLEVSFVSFQQGMPLAIDVFEFMKQAGFVIYDILALTHRPLDGRMGQADVFFLRNDHWLLQDVRWSPER